MTTDRNEASLTLNYWKAEDDLSEETWTIRDTKTRDRVFAHFHRHLGEKWQASEEKYTRLQAMRWPLILAVVVALVTAGGWWYAQTVADAGGPGKMKNWKLWLVSEALWILTPLGVLIAGGIAIALLAWWLVERLRMPPHEITLTKRE